MCYESSVFALRLPSVVRPMTATHNFSRAVSLTPFTWSFVLHPVAPVRAFRPYPGVHPGPHHMQRCNSNLSTHFPPISDLFVGGYAAGLAGNMPRRGPPIAKNKRKGKGRWGQGRKARGANAKRGRTGRRELSAQLPRAKGEAGTLTVETRATAGTAVRPPAPPNKANS